MQFFFFAGQGGSHLYFADSGKYDIYKMSVLGGPLIPLNLSAQVRIKYPRGIAYDHVRNLLYWTDREQGHEKIGRLSLLDGQVKTMPLSSGRKIEICLIYIVFSIVKLST